MGNGTIYSFEHPQNLTGFDIKYTFGRKNENIKFLWTPYQDVDEEGIFRNIHNGQVLENLDWGNAEPNGKRGENHVGFLLDNSKFYDIENFRNFDTGQSCNKTFSEMIIAQDLRLHNQFCNFIFFIQISLNLSSAHFQYLESFSWKTTSQ